LLRAATMTQARLRSVRVRNEQRRAFRAGWVCTMTNGRPMQARLFCFGLVYRNFPRFKALETIFSFPIHFFLISFADRHISSLLVSIREFLFFFQDDLQGDADQLFFQLLKILTLSIMSPMKASNFVALGVNEIL
jgi:hypothetical protein